jgi:hypothetical protein
MQGDPQLAAVVERLARDEPTATLSSLAKMKADLDSAAAKLVAEALRAGASWAEIGAALGVTRQAAHARYSESINGDGAPQQPTVTMDARRAVRLARQEAIGLGVDVVEPVHLLLGVIATRDGTAAQALAGLGVSLERARRAADPVPGRRAAEAARRDGRRPRPRLSGQGRRILEQAAYEMRDRADNRLGAEHLLLALVSDPSGDAAKALGRLGITTSTVRKRLERRRPPSGRS